MNPEKEILTDVHALLTDLTYKQIFIKQRLRKIKDKISRINNDYFETKCNSKLFKQFLNCYDDCDVNTEIINNLSILVSYVQILIEKCCDHEWTTDTIDINPEKSVEICYCVKCEVTKKYY